MQQFAAFYPPFGPGASFDYAMVTPYQRTIIEALTGALNFGPGQIAGILESQPTLFHGHNQVDQLSQFEAGSLIQLLQLDLAKLQNFYRAHGLDGPAPQSGGDRAA